MSTTREELLDYVFYLQEKLGDRFNNITKKLTYGIDTVSFESLLTNVIQEIIIEYYPEANSSSVVTLTFSGTFPGSYNTDFNLRCKDFVYPLGNLTFLFTSLTQFNDEFVSMVNAQNVCSAEVSGTDIILTIPSFLEADFTSVDVINSGEVITSSVVVTTRGVEAEANCLSEAEMCELINYAEMYINSTESC